MRGVSCVGSGAAFRAFSFRIRSAVTAECTPPCGNAQRRTLLELKDLLSGSRARGVISREVITHHVLSSKGDGRVIVFQHRRGVDWTLFRVRIINIPTPHHTGVVFRQHRPHFTNGGQARRGAGGNGRTCFLSSSKPEAVRELIVFFLRNGSFTPLLS